MPSQRSHLSSVHLRHSFVKYACHLEGNEGVGEGRMVQWSVCNHHLQSPSYTVTGSQGLDRVHTRRWFCRKKVRVFQPHS